MSAMVLLIESLTGRDIAKTIDHSLLELDGAQAPVGAPSRAVEGGY